MEKEWRVVCYRKMGSEEETNKMEDKAEIPRALDRSELPPKTEEPKLKKADELHKFERKCDWIDPSLLMFWQPIQLALKHPIHGAGLRAYHYLGEIIKDGSKEFVFGTAQSGDLESHPKIWNRWAANALWLTAGKNHFVDPTELIVLQFEDSGQPRVWGNHWPDRTPLEDKRHHWSYMDHLFSDHYALHRQLCAHNSFHGFREIAEWQRARARVKSMLLQDETSHCGIDCTECDVGVKLRTAFTNSYQVSMPSNKLKIKPSENLCAKTLRGQVKVFVPGEQPEKKDVSSHAAYSGPIKLARLEHH